MALTYIEKAILEFPDSGDDLKTCKELYQKKLWHQLTDELDKLILTSSCAIDFIRFEASFIRGFRKYMNTLRYGSIVIQIAQRSYSGSIINEIQGIAFCEQALASIESDEKKSEKEHFDDKVVDHTQTKLLIQTQIALFELLNENNEKSVKIAQQKLDQIYSAINSSVRACPPLIYSRYHFVQSQLFLQTNNSALFYKNAMSYLGYTPMSKITDAQTWANNIALAALVAPHFYDFGELSLNPIMKSLQNTKQEWVLEIVNAYICADVTLYNNVIAKYAQNISQNNILKHDKAKNTLNEKIKLISIARLAFDKASFERIISFEEIRDVTQCNDGSVEYLIMKAMSLKLINGIIDQIDQTVQVQWVKPAILDIKQMEAINKKVQVWIQKIEQTQKDIVPLLK